jgi:hypothetical protein
VFLWPVSIPLRVGVRRSPNPSSTPIPFVSTLCFDFRLGLVHIPLLEPQSGTRASFPVLELCFCGLFLFPCEFHEPVFRSLPQDFLLASGNRFPSFRLTSGSGPFRFLLLGVGFPSACPPCGGFSFPVPQLCGRRSSLALPLGIVRSGLPLGSWYLSAPVFGADFGAASS